METWKMVWRQGLAPSLPTAGLVALRDALAGDDFRLLQGATTSPPPLMCVQDFECEAGCVISFCGWQGLGLTTVGEVEEFFAKVTYECDQRMGEPAACRFLLNWLDDTPRNQMRRELLEEVELSLQQRAETAA